MAVNLQNPVMRDFAFFSTACIAKMFFGAFVTIYNRFKYKAFANAEDAKGKGRIDRSNEAVERTRRNHLNDLENIIPFVLVGCFYVLTNPDRTTALWHFRIFFYSRIVHFIAYQMALPQPSRALSWMVGLMATLSMMYQIFKATF